MEKYTIVAMPVDVRGDIEVGEDPIIHHCRAESSDEAQMTFTKDYRARVLAIFAGHHNDIADGRVVL